VTIIGRWTSLLVVRWKAYFLLIAIGDVLAIGLFVSESP
jgi:hypothetical protein